MSTILNLKGRKPRVVRHGEVYIGRACYMGGWELPASEWANPFGVGRYGRDEALRRYEVYVRANPILMARLHVLMGQNLVCWCAPEPCHGDILLRLLAEHTGAA
jgi:hypothetical protein